MSFNKILILLCFVTIIISSIFFIPVEQYATINSTGTSNSINLNQYDEKEYYNIFNIPKIGQKRISSIKPAGYNSYFDLLLNTNLIFTEYIIRFPVIIGLFLLIKRFQNATIATLDYLINTLLALVLVVTLILFFMIGTIFWYAFLPIISILNKIRIFNKTQDQYKYDLRFWIESLNILDALLVITYIISLSLYFISAELREFCLYLNIGSFILCIFNSTTKSDYFANRSIFALPYVDFNQKPKFIVSKINDIARYDLFTEDIEILKGLKYDDIKTNKFDENENFRNSIYRLTRCQFVIKKEIDDTSYILSINKKILPYLYDD